MVLLDKTKSRARAAELLSQLESYESGAKYYNALLDGGLLPPAKADTAAYRVKYYTETAAAIRIALSLLTDTEKEVVTLLFCRGMSILDVCDSVALERSSVYAYRASALDKVARYMRAHGERGHGSK